MDNFWVYPLLFTLILVALTFKTFIQKNKKCKTYLPPSPPCLPFIGHLHLLKDPVHRSLQKLSEKYGPVFYLKFGVRPVIIVSSTTAIEECFTKNDIVWANRPLLLMGKYLGYDFNTLITSPYGEHWRNLRRITSLEMLSQHRLSMSSGIRKDETLQMVKNLYNKDYAKVDLKTVFKNLMFNIIMRMLAGKRYFGGAATDVQSKEAIQFTEIITEVFEFAGAAHPGDYVPILRRIDYGGYVRRIKRLAKKSDAFFQGLIDEHRSGLKNTEGDETMISRLLSLQESEPEYYTDETIKGLILVLLAAGTDTSSVTLEWAMSLLLNHPNILAKVKSEIDNQVGEDHLVDELDLLKLQFLQNIISETLRMFPAVPLLLPHTSSKECTIGGFDVPPGTMLLVNAWAVHRDPNLWNEPEEFKPERFDCTDADQYKLLPFGLGRRGCPGANLGTRMVGLALGSLIQCFEWKRVSDEEVDMMEGRGLNMPKLHPLEAMCRARSNTSKFL
ncbi:hypothetical protein RND81_06G037400 [Saponaria officinalis]|uniref:Cytochrome P450 n=1 Tax=Saponaria officinalis TaxID=3572 RepID=A0AAW1K7E8_SAPOF